MKVENHDAKKPRVDMELLLISKSNLLVALHAVVAKAKILSLISIVTKRKLYLLPNHPIFLIIQTCFYENSSGHSICPYYFIVFLPKRT